MPETNHEIDVDVRINRFRLDEECEKQSSLYQYWAEKEADAKAEVDDAEGALKLLKAKTNMNIRKGVGVPTGLKITEDVVLQLVEADEDVVHKGELVRKAYRALYQLQAAVRALDHRKSELDNLTYIMGRSARGFSAKSDPQEVVVSDQQRTNLNRGHQQQ